MRGWLVCCVLVVAGCATSPKVPPGPVPAACTGYYLGPARFTAAEWAALEPVRQAYYTCFFNVYIDGRLVSKSSLPRHPDVMHEERVAEVEAARRELAAAYAQAKADAAVVCRSRTACDQAFARAQVFVATHADRKIQLVTDVLVETYNVGDDGGVAMRVTRLPLGDGSEEVRLTLFCKHGKKGPPVCITHEIRLYREFADFLRAFK